MYQPSGHTGLCLGQQCQLSERVKMPLCDTMGTGGGGGDCFNALHGQNNFFFQLAIFHGPLCLRLDEGAQAQNLQRCPLRWRPRDMPVLCLAARVPLSLSHVPPSSQPPRKGRVGAGPAGETSLGAQALCRPRSSSPGGSR